MGGNESMPLGRLPRVGPLPGLLIYTGVIVAVLAVSVASIAGLAVWQTLSGIKHGVHLAHVRGTNEPVPQVGSIAGAVNMLLTGSDTRTGQGGFQDRADLAGSSGAGNNDVTMVMHISADHQHATVISIPRDLLVNIPACPRANGSVAGPAYNAMFNTTLSRHEPQRQVRRVQPGRWRTDDSGRGCTGIPSQSTRSR
jgi:anionic cell wall polymer biosynthesis LytR-Cps2A-Psr (LCP) family protein